MKAGTKIKLKRTERMLSQIELSNKIGCSNVWLSQVERNSKQPSLVFITKIAGALGVPTSSLISDEE